MVIAKLSGNSMYPTIKDKSKVCYSKTRNNKIAKGDIIVFRTPSNYFIAHRVLKKYIICGHVYYLQLGDNTTLPTIIPSGDVIGVIASIVGKRSQGVTKVATCKNVITYSYWNVALLCLPLIASLCSFIKREKLFIGILSMTIVLFSIPIKMWQKLFPVRMRIARIINGYKKQ